MNDKGKGKERKGKERKGKERKGKEGKGKEGKGRRKNCIEYPKLLPCLLFSGWTKHADSYHGDFG